MIEPRGVGRPATWVAGHPLTSAREVMEQLASPLEILANLIFLATNAAACTEEIISYMHLAEEQMSVICQISAAVGKAAEIPVVLD